MKWIALSIVVAALIVAGAVFAADRHGRDCDDNPYTSTPAC